MDFKVGYTISYCPLFVGLTLFDPVVIMWSKNRYNPHFSSHFQGPRSPLSSLDSFISSHNTFVCLRSTMMPAIIR